MKKKLVSLLLVSMFGSMLIAPSTTKLLTAAAEEIFTVHYAEYIPEHTQEFVSKFNSEIMKNVKKGEDIDENALLKASSVEFVCQIYNLAKDAYNTYLDFDGENGYMLIDDNNIMYDFSTNGDRPYLRNYQGNIFYDHSGYCYYDVEEKTYCRFMNENISDNEVLNENVASLRSEGVDEIITTEHLTQYFCRVYSDFLTTSGGNGYIFRGYTFSDKNLDHEFQYFNQDLTSVYFRATGNSEGNCMLHSSWQLLNYWALYNTTALPSYNSMGMGSVVYKSYSADVVFNSLTGTGYGINNQKPSYYNSSMFKLPTLYSEIRDYCVSRGYRVSGEVNQATVNNAIKYVCNNYGYKNTTVTQNNNYTFSTISSSLNEDHPVCFAVYDDICYDDHAVVITGYRIYTINYTKGGINGQKTVVFAKIADGWSEIDNDEHAEACWIDIPSASSDTNLAQYNRFTSSYIWRVNVI